MTHGFSSRHADLWDWFWAIEHGQRPAPFIAVWPRGGAKSTSAELGAVSVGARGQRFYVLYICETQPQADEHVSNIASMLEAATVAQHYPALSERRVGKYGSSKGWRREQLRTASGFNVAGIGLDVARRGAKLDEYRPDLIIFDDIDGITDTPQATAKKVATLTKSLLPAGSVDCAVLGVQNLIHGNSIFAQLTDGRADFLADRTVSGPYQAVENLTWTIQDTMPIITGGTATWEGQSLAICQQQISTWGASSFLSESQQEVGREGKYFTSFRDEWHVITPHQIDYRRWEFWASLDHGFNHPMAFYVHAKLPDGSIETIGEYVAQYKMVSENGPRMLDLLSSLGLKPENLQCIAAGTDVSKRDGKDENTIADEYAKFGFYLEPANTKRVDGALEMRERLGDVARGIDATWHIWDTCPSLIACIKRMIANPLQPEDVLKVNATKKSPGDDEYDAARYGIMVAARERTNVPIATTGPRPAYATAIKVRR